MINHNPYQLTGVFTITALTILLTACTLPGADQNAAPARATATPFPTQTPFPTWTATVPPVPTDPPTATVEPTATAEGEAGGEETGATAPQGLAATLAFGSNVRTGPDPGADVIGFLDAGAAVTVVARSEGSAWLLVELPGGGRGWIAASQFTGVGNIGPLPVTMEQVAAADTNLPQPAGGGQAPAPTVTPAAVAETGDEEEQPTATAGPTSIPSYPYVPALLVMRAGGEPACVEVYDDTDRIYDIPSPDHYYVEFNSLRPDTVPEASAYELQARGVPGFIDVYIDGYVYPANCAGLRCTDVRFVLCGKADPDSPTGEFNYETQVVLSVGTQRYDEYFDAATAYYIDTIWRVRALDAPGY